MRAWLVDTFSDGEFLGNPAAVVLGDDLPDDGLMQSVAHRLAEPTTAFLAAVAPGEYRIRWFTPHKEINLCGHATIASAGFLYETVGGGPAAILRFVTRNGALYTERVGGRIAIDMPRADVTPCAAPDGLREAIGTDFVRCAESSDDLLIEVGSEAVVAAATPRYAALANFPYRGHIVTAAADRSDADFVSRTFFPSLGVDEDQVCVSAHCKLGPYWGARFGRTRLSGVQLSERGGRLDVEVGLDRVKIFGTARLRPSPVVVPETGQIAALG
jgi:PhzF family phenazine biosynthesis protein